MTTVIFSHGQESGPWGTKIRAMAEVVRELGCKADSVDYQGISDPTDRVNKLLSECGDVDDALILVGSSMGGHVATAAADALQVSVREIARAGARGLYAGVRDDHGSSRQIENLVDCRR
jgi:predicted esterase YcpF (UPF0227 family)